MKKPPYSSTTEENLVEYSVFHVTKAPALILYQVLEFSCFAVYKSVSEDVLTMRDYAVDSAVKANWCQRLLSYSPALSAMTCKAKNQNLPWQSCCAQPKAVLRGLLAF